MKVYKGIPALGPLADKIAGELDIPDFTGRIFPETGTARPRGWGLIGQYSGRRSVAKKKAAVGNARRRPVV